jgi:hypothetical protein
MTNYDYWKTSTPKEVFTGEYCCYCGYEIYEGEVIMRSPEVVVHKECFYDYIYNEYEFNEEVAEVIE